MWSRFTSGITSGTRGSSRWFLEFEETRCPARAYCSSSSPATEASSAEKRTGERSFSAGPRTLSRATPSGIRVVSFQRAPTASA